MSSFLIVLFTILLVLICFAILLLVLIQKPSSQGMGSAISGGDGIAESAFGTESGKVLRKFTIYSIILFFSLSFILYLGNINNFYATEDENLGILEKVDVPKSSAVKESSEFITPDGSKTTGGKSSVNENPDSTQAPVVDPKDQ